MQFWNLSLKLRLLVFNFLVLLFLYIVLYQKKWRNRSQQHGHMTVFTSDHVASVVVRHSFLSSISSRNAIWYEIILNVFAQVLIFFFLSFCFKLLYMGKKRTFRFLFSVWFYYSWLLSISTKYTPIRSVILALHIILSCGFILLLLVA